MSISNLSPYDVVLDTRNLKCPLPLLKVKQALSTLTPGQVLWIMSDQPSLSLDIKTLLRQTQDQLISEACTEDVFNFFILKQHSV